jgi:hypothetical protein
MKNYKNIVNSLISASKDNDSLKKDRKIFRLVMIGIMIFASVSVNFIASTAHAANGKKFLQRYSCTVDKKMENHKWRSLRKKGLLYSEKNANGGIRVVLKEDKHKLEMVVPFSGRAGYGPINVVNKSSKVKLAAVNHKLIGEVESNNKKYRVSCVQ